MNLLGKGAAFHLCAPFPRAREGGASARVTIRRRRRAAPGPVRRERIETADRGVRVLPLRPVSSCARGRRLGQGFDPAVPARSCGDSSARADRNRWPRDPRFTFAPRFLVRARAAPRPAVYDLAGAGAELWGLFGAAESKRWPGIRVFTLRPVSSCARGAAPRPGVSIRRCRRGAVGTLRRERIETAGRGVAAACVRSGISGWVIGLLIHCARRR